MEPSKLERTLRFYNKVRTGCLTCKKRKVKCDEEKPHCRRCTRTGRQCEGYRPDRLSPATPDTTGLAPHSGLFASAAERRSFFYFQSEACKPLGGHFNSSFWGREVMRAAIHYPPIRHLVIALGAEYETFEIGTTGQAAQFSLQQCNASIKHLTTLHTKGADAPSAETTCCVLTASVLFIYFASIRGHFLEAFQHVKSAVKVLQDFERSLLQKHHRTTSSGYPVPVSQLRALIISIYGQLRAMLNDVPLETGSPDILVSEQKPATIFTSVPEAHSFVETLFHNTLAFLQEMSLRSQFTATQLEVAVARHGELCRALQSSENALDILAKGLLEAGDTIAQEGIVVLRVYHLLLAIRLRIDIFRPDERESAFDDLEAHLEEMLRHCEALAQRKQGDVSKGQRSCSSGLGYVMPLHMVAARCRNPCLRRRAVQLLLSSSHREGLWDAHLAGRIVSQTIEMEEQAIGSLLDGGERVPADRRVRQVKLEFQGERGATIRFVTVDDWKQGRLGSHRLIEW